MVFLLFVVIPSLTSAADHQTIVANVTTNRLYIDGVQQELSPGYEMLEYNWRNYVPIRFVAEKLGAHVDYDADEDAVRILHPRVAVDPLVADVVVKDLIVEYRDKDCWIEGNLVIRDPSVVDKVFLFAKLTFYDSEGIELGYTWFSDEFAPGSNKLDSSLNQFDTFAKEPLNKTESVALQVVAYGEQYVNAMMLPDPEKHGQLYQMVEEFYPLFNNREYMKLVELGWIRGVEYVQGYLYQRNWMGEIRHARLLAIQPQPVTVDGLDRETLKVFVQVTTDQETFIDSFVGEYVDGKWVNLNYVSHQTSPTLP